MPTESIYERIAGRQISLALVIGFLGIATLAALTVAFQWSRWMGFDLTQSFTDVWLWVLFTGSAVCVTLINYGLWQRKAPKNAQEEALTVEKESSPPEMALNDLAISQLWVYARMGFTNLLKMNLNMMGDYFKNGRIPYRFKSWDDAEPELKKRLVAKPEYDALDDFAKSLTQCPRHDEPNFDVMSNLCKNHFERLKRLGLVELGKTLQ